MFRTLRSRFLVSHVLPLLVTIPLIGVTLTYLLETQVLLQNVTNQLRAQAMLLAGMTGQLPGIWYDRVIAQTFVLQLAPSVDAQVLLLDASGRLLASSDPNDSPYLGQSLNLPDWALVQAGTVIVRRSYSARLHADVVEVLAPVLEPSQQLAGVVGVSHQLPAASQRFVRVRSLVAGVLVAGLLVGAALGWVLALNLERPLQEVTQAVRRLTGGEQTVTLREQGPREVRLLSQSVNSLVERLHNLEQTRQQLLSNLVHELGRPLGALRSGIQALLRGADEQPSLRQELLVGMDGEIGHLQRLLDDLAGLHSQVLGIVGLELHPISPSEWLPAVLAPWRQAAQAKGLQCTVDIPQDLPTLEVDPDRLAQALGNLMSNAVKFTPPGGRVGAAAGVSEGSVWIEVNDTGPGIAKEDQELVFTPFFRDRTDRRFPQGMGLGLSIARDLVSAHGGRLELQSAPGEGSRFRVWLPCPETPAKS